MVSLRMVGNGLWPRIREKRVQADLPEEPQVADEVAGTSEARVESWTFWRGSPELLGHVARVAEREAASYDRGQTTCMIDVEVAGDHEIFWSPRDFVETVTREALQRFNSITIEARGDALQIVVRFLWRRPWWHPVSFRDVLMVDPSQDGDTSVKVVASVLGESPTKVDLAQAALRAAILRGGADDGPRSLVPFLVLVMTFSLIVVGTMSFAFLALSTVPTGPPALMIAAVGGIVGVVFTSWAYPSLEVAAKSETRLWRLARYLGTATGSLLVAAIAKGLLG
jgi:hypothetical protein